jgi:hypothetical protein
MGAVMDKGNPYLSIVITFRNDDQGANLLHHMQLFVTCWLEQAK